MHAPKDVTWEICGGDPFKAGGRSGPNGDGDNAADPIQRVLPQVIEATNRVIVSNGDYDMVIMTDGTLLSIQNMTWGGLLGFQTKPSEPLNVHFPDMDNSDNYTNGWQGTMQVAHLLVLLAHKEADANAKHRGIKHFERGLMWVQTFQSGHMQPQYQPRVAWRQLEWMLGRIDDL